MTVTDPVVAPVLDGLLSCLEIEIAQVATPPANVMLRPGDRIELLLSQSRDECCEGLAWVRQVNLYPSREFPQQDVTRWNVGTLQWAIVVEVGAARCAPTPDADTLPSADEWNTVTRAVLDDQAALRRTILRFVRDSGDRMVIPGLWSPLTTEGGCVGGFMQVTVAADICDTLT